MKKQGYKEMLRDRCPEVVNFALKWCKAKERWINHVYDCFVRIVGDEVLENGTIKYTKKDRSVNPCPFIIIQLFYKCLTLS